MKLPLQLLDPPAILPSFHGAGRPRLAETGDRILLPGVQLRRKQTLLAAPSSQLFPFGATSYGVSPPEPR
jgi:hypothetical protein